MKRNFKYQTVKNEIWQIWNGKKRNEQILKRNLHIFETVKQRLCDICEDQGILCTVLFLLVFMLPENMKNTKKACWVLNNIDLCEKSCVKLSMYLVSSKKIMLLLMCSAGLTTPYKSEGS